MRINWPTIEKYEARINVRQNRIAKLKYINRLSLNEHDSQKSINHRISNTLKEFHNIALKISKPIKTLIDHAGKFADQFV